MESGITTKPTTSPSLPASTTEIVTTWIPPTRPTKPTKPTTTAKPTTPTTMKPTTITTTLRPTSTTTSTTTLKPATSEYFKVVCYFTNWAWYRFVFEKIML